MNSNLVIDIGGGSTEIIYGIGKEIIFSKSIPLGVVSLSEAVRNKSNGINSVLPLLEEEISSILDLISFPNEQIENTFAVAGTPTTLAAIKNHLNSFDEEKIHGEILTLCDIQYFIESIKSLSGIDILRKFGVIVKGREDLLLSGSLILYYIMNKMNIDKVLVSTKGLRYGVIIDRHL